MSDGLVVRASWLFFGADRCAARVALGLLAFLVGATACSKEGSDATGVASSASAPEPPKPQLPAPFTTLRLGDDLEAIKKAYPPLEDTSACAPKLVGGDEAMPALASEADKKPRSYCARAHEIAGLTEGEQARLLQVAAGIESNDSAAVEVMAALTYTAAQVRGSVRAGTIDDSVVFDASGSSKNAFDAVLHVAGKLYDGSAKFLRPQSGRRIVCAAVAHDCVGLDPERVRGYVMGEYSLGVLDSEARRRVANSKCRGPYVRGERSFKRSFAVRTGGLAGIGLAKAAQKDRKLDPDKLATYRTFSGRSRLDAPAAQLGVRIANALPETEKFWAGAVVLVAGGHQEPWGRALVWFNGGKVSQILVNIEDEAKLHALPELLSKRYGNPASAEGVTTQWSLDGGGKAVLNIGGAASLLVTSVDAQPAKAAKQ